MSTGAERAQDAVADPLDVVPRRRVPGGRKRAVPELVHQSIDGAGVAAVDRDPHAVLRQQAARRRADAARPAGDQRDAAVQIGVASPRLPFRHRHG